MTRFSRIVSILTVTVSVGLLLTFCPAAYPNQDSGSLQIKGSDTMVNLGQAWAEEFMMKHPEASIAVTGGGSGTGIASLINGTCDVAEASREMKPQELDIAKQNGRDVREYKVAIDAVAVVVNPSNPVKELTVEQMSRIYTGEYTNWKELGGKDQKILALSRERNSGTHVFFLEHVVRKGNEKGPEQFAPPVLMLPSSQAIIEEVAQSEGTIGYVGLGYVSPRVKPLGVSKSPEGPFIYPTMGTALDGAYPLSRYLLFYTATEPHGIEKTFIDFVLSDEGQKIVETMDFVPLRKKA
ncbi:MAG TPA: phosphate ABC transporter substrate-binding protein [Candidatus Omnitrophota bacterium]|nr:phosphate ABC transporter substrate-binding protein [Candidatus Omnitrophota bacterium]